MKISKSTVVAALLHFLTPTVGHLPLIFSAILLATTCSAAQSLDELQQHSPDDSAITVSQSLAESQKVSVKTTIPQKPPSYDLKFLGRWYNGPVFASAISGDYVYFGSGGSIRVLKINKDASWQEVTSLPIAGVVRGLFASGSYLYVADESGALRIIDNSIPDKLKTLGTVDLPRQTRTVFVKDQVSKAKLVTQEHKASRARLVIPEHKVSRAKSVTPELKESKARLAIPAHKVSRAKLVTQEHKVFKVRSVIPDHKAPRERTSQPQVMYF